MSRCLILIALSLLLLAGSLPVALAHPGHEEESRPVPDYTFDSPDEMVESHVLENELWYDADVCSLGGQLWYAWLELAPGKGDLT